MNLASSPPQTPESKANYNRHDLRIHRELYIPSTEHPITPLAPNSLDTLHSITSAVYGTLIDYIVRIRRSSRTSSNGETTTTTTTTTTSTPICTYTFKEGIRQFLYLSYDGAKRCDAARDEMEDLVFAAWQAYEQARIGGSSLEPFLHNLRGAVSAFYQVDIEARDIRVYDSFGSYLAGRPARLL
ncbi:hypothetical protein TWF730_008942 [Orbilia blumenaviensis]|uniref:Uncharacterized protein n=1 Tax=Orbilia blumenaviensis TaxID=1796055 RepID=A0AAV9V3H5_9PEZI